MTTVAEQLKEKNTLEFTSNDVIEETETQKKNKEYASILMRYFTFKTLKDSKEILYYSEGVYVPGGEVLIAIECEKMVSDNSKHTTSEIKEVIRNKTYCERDIFNTDFSKIVLNNGTLDLDKMELGEYTSDFLCTVKIPIDYDPKARCPKFIDFLKSSLKPRDIITVVEGMANILSVNRQNVEISMMWIGDGSNGKSCALKIIEGVIGSDNCSHVSIHEMNNDRFAISQLYGKLVNTHADISNKELNTLGKFKQLVSGDTIAAQKKGKDHFNFVNFAKMFFSANEMPNIIDNSDGAFRRIYVTKWESQFLPGVNQIENYDIIILKEKSGIFNVLLQNYRGLLKQGFRYKQNIAQVRKIIKQESDKLLEYIDSCLVKEMNNDIAVDYFYEILQKWFNDKNYEVFSKQKIGANLPTYGISKAIKKVNGKTKRVWKNISFNFEDDFIKNNVKKGLEFYE